MNVIEQIKSLESHDKLSAELVFEAISMAGSLLNDSDRESSEALEIAIRLLSARKNGQLPIEFYKVVEYLAEECGLYQYIEVENFGLVTQSIIEAHSVKLGGKRYLHAKQMQALLILLNGENLILSAPTSFGKSLLVDAYLSISKPHTVVMILPTIALIDETRRRLLSVFRDYYKVITSATAHYEEGRPTIFVLTQERYLIREDIKAIDLFFVDEFYKLDPSRDDSRYEKLNIALYHALKIAKQSFMAGPNIKRIELGALWASSFKFLQTDFRTVTVNIVDRSGSENRLALFLKDLSSVRSEASLIFTASPGSAHSLLNTIVVKNYGTPSKTGAALGEWISKNYHPNWALSCAAKRGIAVHHGRLPRALGQLFINLFDKGVITILICTSTLIEGVNTSAANVFVYDKKINRTDFDFFSFSNIRGRVGRMMQHFVGNAFLYHEPPEEIETNVSVPVLCDPGGSTDYIVMNVDFESLSLPGKIRQIELPEKTGLSDEILKEHGSLGVDLLINLRLRVISELGKS